MKKYHKTVLSPISVPCGNYCFGDGRCCGYFNNEDGYPQCLFNWNLKYDSRSYVLKAKECKELKEI